MALNIQEFRVSFIAAEIYLDLLKPNPPQGAPYSFLGRQAEFASRFNAVLNKQPGRGKFALPWKDVQKPSFWYFYFDRKLAKANGDEAWRKLAPLRRPFGEHFVADWLGGEVVLQGFFYPFGHALVLSLTVRPGGCDGKPLDDVIGLALQIKRGGKFRSASGGADETLDDLFARQLSALRAEALGPGAPPERTTAAQPFSVFTIVRGSGVTIPEPVPDPPIDEAMQRILWALCSWDPEYHGATLQPFNQVNIQKRRGRPREHVLYSAPRGRAVWFPRSFMSEEEERSHPLGVYHRNLVACTLQVDAVCAFIQEVARMLDAGAPLLEPLRGAAKNAKNIVNRLYVGSERTYQSWSARTQIEKRGGMISDLDRVRKAFGEDPFQMPPTKSPG